MKRLLLPIVFFLAAIPANADILHTITKSTSLKVNAAATASERIGSSFSISGSGVDVTDGTTAGTLSSGTITSGIYNPGTIAATLNSSDGESFSFSQNFTQGDVVPTSAPSVGAVPNFSEITSTAAGTAGDLAGTITDTAITLTPGSSGTEAIGQIINEIKID